MLAARAVGVFCVTVFLSWAGLVWPTLPYPSRLFHALEWLIGGAGFVVLPTATIAAVIGIPVALYCAVKRRVRRGAVGALTCCIAVLAGTIAGAGTGRIHRMQRIAAASAEAMPLVRAIEAFETTQGRAPSKLEELVPQYIPAIPPTGMGGYDKWRYVTGQDALDDYGNTWVLVVSTPGPGFNFDQLMYFPNQRYPERGYGGSLERLGRWAYVHE